MINHINEEINDAEKYIVFLHEHKEYAPIIEQIAREEVCHAKNLIYIAEHEGADTSSVMPRLHEVEEKFNHHAN